jgi:DNA-binding NtrC family response regulator
MSGPGTYLEKPVSPDAYLYAIQRALGIEESQAVVEKRDLKEQLDKRLQTASREAMRRVLEALGRTNKG